MRRLFFEQPKQMFKLIDKKIITISVYFDLCILTSIYIFVYNVNQKPDTKRMLRTAAEECSKIVYNWASPQDNGAHVKSL